jgi:hypothetical protein
MLWFILALALLVVGFIIFILCKDEYSDFAEFMSGLSIFLGIGGFIVLFAASVSSIGIKSDWRCFENEYAFTKELIENYDGGDDYGNVPALTEKVLQINKTISKHRAGYNSPWWNIWRSEDIGNLEPLKLPSRKTEKAGI